MEKELNFEIWKLLDLDPIHNPLTGEKINRKEYIKLNKKFNGINQQNKIISKYATGKSTVSKKEKSWWKKIANLLKKKNTEQLVDADEKMCVKFSSNPEINPFNEQPLKKGSHVYKKLVGDCKLFRCTQLYTNSKVNPSTGKKWRFYGQMKRFDAFQECFQDMIYYMPQASMNEIYTRAVKKQYTTGTLLTNYIMILYILQKHKNDCSPIDAKMKDIKHDIFSSIFSMIITCKPKKKEKMYKNFDIFLPKDIKKRFNTCIKKKSARFIFLFIGITFPYERNGFTVTAGGHANTLIYDKKTKNIERFEPHGSAQEMYNGIEMDNQIIKELKKHGITFNEYYGPLKYMPEITLQSYDGLFKTQKYDPEGYCAYYTMQYIDYRLSLPNKSRKELIEIWDGMIIRNLKKSPNNPDSRLVRKYANFMNKILDDIYISLSAEKDLAYSNIDDKIHKIISKHIKKTS